MLLDFKFRYQFRGKTKDGFNLKFAIGSIQLKSSKVKIEPFFIFPMTIYMYIRKWKSFLLYIKVIERIKDKYNSIGPIFNWTENVCNTIKDRCNS